MAQLAIQAARLRPLGSAGAPQTPTPGDGSPFLRTTDTVFRTAHPGTIRNYQQVLHSPHLSEGAQKVWPSTLGELGDETTFTQTSLLTPKGYFP
jgi:hypothetical protein